ncbi:procathepsin L-like [Planococcus citri]|uniref:procathepsin L-like n=1 Tax=Planococcus citri TaxID=170843 RepID=UPI0031F8C671
MRWQFSVCLSIVCLGFIRAKSIPGFPEDQWGRFKLEFNKNYRSENEENLRQGIFMNNIQRINQHNERFANGEVSFTKEIDQYTDMGENEVPNSLYSPTNNESMYIELPKEKDWRKENAVTKVRDQGGCEKGDWAFAAIGAVEGLLSIRDKKLSPELSVQELIDCSGAMGNYGCGGGVVTKAFDYINDEGISKETSYPFIEKNSEKCSNEHQDKIAKGLDIQLDFATNNESQMKSYLFHNGPLLAVINTSLASFENYTGDDGIYKDEECGKSGGEHNVLIVGYNEEKGEKYWIVKNSWGEGWGDKGYIKIARDKNICGIANNANFLSYGNNKSKYS